MTTTYAILITCLLGVAHANEKPYPKTILDKLLSLYIAEGIQGIDKVETLPSMKKTIQAQIKALLQVETFFGKPLSYKKLKHITQIKSTSFVHFIIEYEHGPLFGIATVYEKNNKQFIPFMKFHTNALEIFPDSIIFGVNK